MTVRQSAAVFGALVSIATFGTGQAVAAFLSNQVTLGGISITTAGTPPSPPGPQSFTIQLAAVADAELDQAQPDENRGGKSSADVASWTSRNRRALYRFDLGQLPAGATITSCKLSLFMNEQPQSNRQHGVYRLTAHEADWGEGAQIGGEADVGSSSWNWFAAPSVWTTPGGDVSASPTSVISTGTAEEVRHDWDVTTDCGTLEPRSWLVRDVSEDAPALVGLGAEYRTREHSRVSERPFLEVVFDVSPPTTDHVVISRAYYDVASSKGNETTNEWVSLYNPTGSTVAVGGWELCDAASCRVIPSGTSINAGGFAVLTPSESTWSYWGVPVASQVVLGGSIGNGLSNTGDRVVLKQGSITVDALSYGGNDSVFSPSLPDIDEGWALQRLTPGFDTDAASDFWATVSPTPAG